MRYTTRIGLFVACIGLIAPRVFGDAILLEGKTFSSQSEVFLIQVEQGQSTDNSGGFSLDICKHCNVKVDGPFLFNPNLSQGAFRDFFLPFGGNSALSGTSTPTPTPPTALLSSSINAIATESTAAPATTSSSSSTTSSSSPVILADGTVATTGSASTSGGSSSTTSGGSRTISSTVKADPVATNPEPASILLLGAGLGAGVIGRRVTRGRRR